MQYLKSSASARVSVATFVGATTWLLAAPLIFAKPLTTPEQLLQLRISISWNGQELGPGLRRLAESLELQLWIDRRVDLSAAIDLHTQDETLAAVLEKIGARVGAAAAPLETVIYFGPQETADALPGAAVSVRKHLQRIPPSARRRWLAIEVVDWPRLSEPRKLLESLATRVGATFVDADKVPHDLWDSRRLPPMANIDLALLISAGFGLTPYLESTGHRLELRPLSVSASSADSHSKYARRPLKPATDRRSQSTPRGRQVYTLRIERQPLGSVLDQIARQRQLEVVWQEAGSADALRALRVSCDVRQVDLDALLRAILEPLHISFELQGERLTICGDNSSAVTR
jgi:hypothetical protein